MNILKKIKKRLEQPVSLKRKNPVKMKLSVRVTPSGWGFFGLIVCGFLMSINFSNNLIFAMTFLLVSIAMVSWYHTRMNLTDLLLADWKTNPVFAGQVARYELAVENRSSRHRHSLRVNHSKGGLGEEAHLSGREKREMVLERTATQRGVLESVYSTVHSCFPLGIFEAVMTAGALPGCVVYPYPSGNQPLPENSSGVQAHLGAESGTFTDMRRYSPGDPMSRISWKAFAKFDELYTKEFDGAQGQPALWIRWHDVNQSQVEEKLSQLCLWVLTAHKKNREYGLELPDRTIEPAEGLQHLETCLEALALYGQKGAKL